MRRAELIKAIDNVLRVIKLSRVVQATSRAYRNRDDSNNDISAELLEAFRNYSILHVTLGEVEKEILKIMGLSDLVTIETWTKLLKSSKDTTTIDIRSNLYNAIEFLPKFKELLKQDYVEALQLKAEDLPDLLRGKDILTVILPEEHGQFSTAKRISEIIQAISLLYDSFLELIQAPQEPLIILSCDSGSDKSFDFLGVAKAIEAIKDIILSVWDRVVLYREYQYAERLNLITNGMLPAIERISKLEGNGDLGPEQAGKIKKQITTAIYQFLETGATTPEMYQETKFEPRALMGTEPKLLTGTPEVNVSPELDLAGSEEIPDSDIDNNLNAEEKKQLRQLLKKARSPKSNDLNDPLDES